jgi:hypothetical protein
MEEHESSEDSFDAFVRFKKRTMASPSPQSQSSITQHTSSSCDPPKDAVDILESKANFELLFALEKWIHPLEQYTARTIFLELSPAEVIALLKNSDTSNLQQRLNVELKHHFPAGAFCKLHTRSPKDAVVRLDGPIMPLVKQRMAKNPLLWTSKARRTIANNDANLISQVARELFKVSSGAQVLALLSKSSRVQSDLEKARSRGSVLVLREFSLCDPAYEFRAFVHKRHLTGVSQYCYRQYFNEMLKRRPEIEHAITSFFHKVCYVSCFVALL